MVLSRAEIDRRMTAFMETCRRTGVKATHQRMEIFRELARTDEHPDAETVFKRVRRRMPTVSLDTVYRTLSLLEKEGLISRVEILCARARFDGNTTSHHHFVCTECGLVRDFTSHELDDFRPPKEVRPWGDVKSVHVQLRGVCSECKTRS